MRIFVTGATGVIGRRLIPLLARARHDVTAVARSAEQAARLAHQGAAPTHIDLFDPNSVVHAVARHDVIVNLATHIPPASKAFLPGAWRENNRVRREVSRNLIDAALAAGVTRFIQESFAGIYPDGGDAWIDEHTPVQPAKYVRSMLEAEGHAKRFTEAHRTGIVLRFALLYGPDSSHTADTIAYVRKGTAPTFGRRDSFISSLSTDDAATAVAAALTVPAGIYNVCDNEPVRRQEYFDSLAEALGVPKPWVPPAWLSHFFGSLGETIARSQRLSNEKLKRTSGWSPSYATVREGWRAVVNAVEFREIPG